MNNEENEYFNFIVIGSDENFVIENNEISLWISRFLEYTTDEIKELFNDNYKEIINLPCIYTYEGNRSKVYLAKINKFNIKDRNVILSFKDMQEQDINSYDLFDNNRKIIQEWELYRQHWAIKKGNLSTILDDNDNSSNSKNIIEIKPVGFDTSVASSLTVDKQETYIDNVQDLISKLQKNGSGKTVFYRGHSQKKYKLEPSLFRSAEQGFYYYRENEHVIYRELLSLNYAEFSDDDSTFDRLVHMQHFSLPTRLLDITSNPLIALYFSCKSHENEDGDLISITIKDEDLKYFDSDTVACLANLCKLSFSEKEKLNIDDKTNTISNKYLHYIKDDKPYFENRLCDKDVRKVVCVKGKSTNPRIYAQSGAFLLFGLDAILDDDNDFNFNITHYIIKSESKQKILEQLDLLNINESTVFPYLENSAKYISHKFKKIYF